MADAVEEIEDEFIFARQMKDTCCDESGKEANPAKAAEILHQIGLIYSFLLFSCSQFLRFPILAFCNLPSPRYDNSDFRLEKHFPLRNFARVASYKQILKVNAYL